MPVKWAELNNEKLYTMKILYVVDEMPSISTPFILNQIVGQIELNNEIHIWSKKKRLFNNSRGI